MKFYWAARSRACHARIDSLARPLAIRPEHGVVCVIIMKQNHSCRASVFLCAPAPKLSTRPEYLAMTRSKKTAAHYRARMMGLAVVLSAASMGTAGAQALYPSPGGRYRNDSTNLNPQTAPSRWDRARFHRSGTRGRPRPGRQSPAPRRPGQRDTVIRDAAKAGFDPSAGPCQVLADLAGGSAGLAGKAVRRRSNVIIESPSSAGFPPRDAGKSRGAIRH
jgi:hypothetical protein